MRKITLEKINKNDIKEYKRLIEKNRWHDDKVVLKVTQKSPLLPCDYIILRNNGIYLIGLSPVNCSYLTEDPATNREFLCEIYGKGETKYSGYNPHYDLLACLKELNQFLTQHSAFESYVGLSKRFVPVAVRLNNTSDYIWTDYKRPVIDRPISRLSEVLRHESSVVFLTDNEITNTTKCLLSLPYVKRVR